MLALSAVGYSAWQKKRAEKAEAEQRAATEAAGRRAQARPEKKAAADPRFAGVNPDAPAVPEPVPSAPAPVPPEFSAPAPVVSTPPARPPAAPSAPTPVAKSVVPAPVPPPEFVAPSEAFKSWVTGLKINGVRPGAVPRVSIAGASFNQGDTINSELGVTFDGYDAERRMLRFKERSGALLERRDR